MSGPTQLVVSAHLTGAQVASAFWELDSDEQVAFFAHLDHVAGHHLCGQMAYVIASMADGVAGVDSSAARVAFGTMFEHAMARSESITDWRAFIAKQGITQFVRSIKAAP